MTRTPKEQRENMSDIMNEASRKHNEEMIADEEKATHEARERVLKFREEEMVKKLSELFGKLNKLPVDLPEKFDMFRLYFRGIQDGFFITLRSLGIEHTSNQRPITELRIDAIINSFETGKNDVQWTWDELDRELPLSRIYS